LFIKFSLKPIKRSVYGLFAFLGQVNFRSLCLILPCFQ
jgi:hypothetical protein